MTLPERAQQRVERRHDHSLDVRVAQRPNRPTHGPPGQCHAEAFADRLYEPDGSLRSRTLDGALITDAGADAREVKAIEAHGVRVIVAADREAVATS